MWSEIFELIELIMVRWFGWTIYLGALIWMFWWLKRDNNRTAYMDSVKQIFLEVKVDELNEKSPLAMEQVFTALHAIHQNFTWGEDLNGKTVLYLSCEIVSLGGKVSYIFKLPERYRNLFESAVFAQYPKAEIFEVEDYLKNLPHHYDPETADFEFWGTQWNKKKENAYPIRTYYQDTSFEHSAQETFVDPISNLIEAMSSLQPHELMVWQIVIKPVNDDWKEHAAHLVDELKGVPAKHDESLWMTILIAPLKFLGDVMDAFLNPPDPKARKQEPKKEDPSLMLHRTDIEKSIITSIQHGLSKVGYNAKVRGLYLAPKGKFNKSLRVPEFVGAVRNFDDVNLNGLKPDIGHTWTDKAYKISERLERPYLEWHILKRKRHFLHNFIPRSNWRGSGETILNSEELATIFHFPQTPHTRLSQLEKVHTVKSAPPMDLPIGNL
ncbi:MAG: hypothetical protein A3C49_03710 [Candidatus Doudnabacteria bacterium RIFCSPHIGHO2_02_FULL_42_25]|uniref:DUF8128 domain-containing protein n=1 Tax=Candidatus Doudnabacteria bacterium RIFCSPHIGHO2_01_FULL_41_86 TaxID=1817821 RepID=A0A1F5N8D9_9BACT|nr:MAG: hypothetical protein A2717_04690 [Candidatus Doudnabacteria bacterium RIFCSPHIGHO2_01_FULL_41_86]OGE75907.1 MAG: hypothetical protein A3K07_04280 [Candidatus Doudnabacteria bacterium RIFCSPHIGHO2_01_43_10]OGE86282.1 MAG: hypothetical protein A3E28_04045 [Candidatus Doudnabacteria bacterium RIFCSPHIGHO2_12_FULL_42_22]OGE87130.1 MAG: hypothetical protein A3C49_03710 [Candidatus Doudnabacteria bacterium RIFCSPHIGHO2_02_FULL_42_25]OGE92270.1 MAG: hypothetical protein A2895_04395 [Candidatus